MRNADVGRFAEEEVKLLRLALIKYGCGAWTQICRHFPLKKNFQLNIQTQRMFGQQSLREFNNLHLDPTIIFNKNALLTNATRKKNVIISKTTAKQRAKNYEEYKKLQVSEEERAKIRIPIYVGSYPEVGEKNSNNRELLEDMESMFIVADRLQQMANTKQANEILKQRGGKGDLNAVLEEIRMERIKVYQKLLDEEELKYQELLRDGGATGMDFEKKIPQKSKTMNSVAERHASPGGGGQPSLKKQEDAIMKEASSAHAKLQMPQTKLVKPVDWGVQEVIDWLVGINLDFPDLVEKVRSLKIDGNILINDIDEEVLKTDLAVSNLHRKKFLRELAELK